MTDILLSFGLPAFLVLSLCFIAKYYNNVRNFINDLFHFVVSVFHWGKRASIRGDISLVANETIKQLNKVVPELQMPDMDIEWVKEDENGNVRFDKNRAIVMLKFNRDRTQNVINSTSAYIHNTLLTTSRPFMDEPILKAIDYTLMHKFLQNTPERRFATRKYVESSRSEIIQYQDSFDKVNKVDQKGLLTHILLREYTVWGDNIVTELPNEVHRAESREVLDFIYDIATRQPDELTPLQLNNKNTKLAVLLVAKTETYAENGCRPYIRRIRDGFASGINTFYLLARGEKIEILKKVYGELIQTGNFTCINSPEVFHDKEGRENICYCLQIDKTGDMASDYAGIHNAIEESKEIEVSIEHVYKYELKCLYNGRLQVSIPIDEICDHEIHLRSYYISGMTIKVIPISVEQGGIVKASVKETDSNPQKLIDNEYAVGNIVTAIVEESEDNYVKLRIKDSDKQAYAFRRDLTNSKYLFLHDLYKVGLEYEFEILSIDYVSNQLKLKRKDIIDPWLTCDIKKGQSLNIIIYNIEDTYFASEINEGIKIILPYSELGWVYSDIENEKSKIKRNTELSVSVKVVDRERNLIIVTHRPSENPYQLKYESLGGDKFTPVKFISEDEYGIIGDTDGLKVFIPLSETHIADNRFEYSMGKIYNVAIKELATDGRSLIGSLKPFIKHPLDIFDSSFKENSLIEKFKLMHCDGRSYKIKLKDKKYDKCRISLHISEISNLTFISNLCALEPLLCISPLTIKKINYEWNCVELSLKLTLESNNSCKEDMDYDTTYRGVVIGSKDNRYVVVVLNHWIEGYLSMTTLHHIGDEVSFQLAAHGGEYADFYEV